jgi:hypothetical protein
MKRRCDVCIHWNPTEYGWGKCEEIRSKLDIDLIAGHEGADVNYIETEADFGCNEHQFLNE